MVWVKVIAIVEYYIDYEVTVRVAVIMMVKTRVIVGVTIIS